MSANSIINTMKQIASGWNALYTFSAVNHNGYVIDNDTKQQLLTKEVIAGWLCDNFEDNQVILLDTMGELSKLYAISDVAFIGGSFSGTGGHNPLEAAIYDVPVLSGPSTFNFKDIYKFLTDYNAAFVVENENKCQKKG